MNKEMADKENEIHPLSSIKYTPSDLTSVNANAQ
jgi:hypothetical protein